MRGIAAWLMWRGRLRRREFFWRALASAIAFVVLFVFIDSTIGYTATLMLYLPFFAAWLSLMTRRLHDQACSAWWLLVLLIPAIGPVLVGWMLLFRAGSKGENQYGEDPRTNRHDYLQVSIHERA
ncbi:MAG TPA: DUF805 domain-containing protein [Rhodanobacteraceae bacterium]